MIKRPKLPDKPGCYIFKDSREKIIYIGKAKSLKKRVASYFTNSRQDPKTEALVKSIAHVGFIVTDNEVEAFLLENNLIKKNQPKYNIDLKDSKRYAFIQETDEDFPRLVVARNRPGQGRYYGPFVSGAERNSILQFAIRTFRLRTCKRMPKRPCLRHSIKLCDAPCAGKISKGSYMERIRSAGKLLSGKTDSLIAELEYGMRDASANQDYEKALTARDQLNALAYLSEKQKMERQKTYDEDVINFIAHEGRVYLILFNVHKGTLVNKQDFVFGYTDSFIEEFIVQYYSENKVPRELILPQPVEGAVVGFLDKKRGRKVSITVPKIGEKRQLLRLVKKNIELTFFGDETKLSALMSRLKLEMSPSVIECFDISHLSGTSTVGSMVQFRNAKPDKPNYRRFRIRTAGPADDFAAIAEVVRRRYKRLRDEGAEMPDLVVIDGGRGQLNSATCELEKLGLRLPVISIAKKLEEIYLPGLRFPLRLMQKDKALMFIQEMRDEAHRFAISYNRLLRKKEIGR
ncbi:excinuclease ABC subunit C [Candidatus Woesearchaeota archaeon]|nr:excinuclease ABC subunit C [Candidatus Woesearchaeota archaeon]